MSRAVIQNATGISLAFDSIAERYDEIFTNTLVGRAQRNAVWDSLAQVFSPTDRILELNCGTGEDALFLARRGTSVIACDASLAMIAVAQRRKSREASEAKIQFQVLRSEDIHEMAAEAPFDGAFSNFSGLNCVADIQAVALSLGKLVRPGGRVLICLSSRFCAWETLWFLSRMNVSKAFRRFTGRTIAKLNGVSIPVWYPSICFLQKAFSGWFHLRSLRAVGLFVPPSYVESFIGRHEGLLALFANLDRALAGLLFLRCLGDHVLLDFERIQQ
jgi:ubiquinone/menaquinone biosynthesis C-methylase UbiE